MIFRVVHIQSGSAIVVAACYHVTICERIKWRRNRLRECVGNHSYGMTWGAKCLYNFSNNKQYNPSVSECNAYTSSQVLHPWNVTVACNQKTKTPSTPLLKTQQKTFDPLVTLWPLCKVTQFKGCIIFLAITASIECILHCAIHEREADFTECFIPNYNLCRQIYNLSSAFITEPCMLWQDMSKEV